ncbi:right-handed parallel beta-helix repeat-containing protein [Colwelliaceae bacterium BS250]
MFAGKASQQLHRDIVIRGNKISNYPGPAIDVNDAKRVRIENNDINRTQDFKPRNRDSQAIVVGNVADLILNNNTISGYKNTQH